MPKVDDRGARARRAGWPGPEARQVQGHVAYVWLCRDRWGREIVLTEESWYGHIIFEHPVMHGNDALVADAITAPHRVMYDAEHDDREAFYRLGRVPNAPRRLLHRYLKVCVEFLPAGAGGAVLGRVVTAYPSNQFKPGERQKWP